MGKMKKVNDMYVWAKTNNVLLLSDFNADFWQPYLSNHNEYDRIFNRMYKTFIPFMQNKNDDISDITKDFMIDVKGVLTMNAKRYSEIYLVNVLPNDAYDVVNNYSITDKSKTTIKGTVNDTFGSRSDVTDNSIGSHSESTETAIGSVTNKSTEKLGERNDTSSTEYGLSTESTTSKIGAVINSSKEDLGGRKDSETSTFGSHTDTNTHDIAGFNSSDYSNSDITTNAIGSRSDNKSNTIGSQVNEYTNTNGEQNNSESLTKDAHTDSSLNNIGSQTNERTDINGGQNNTETKTYSDHTDIITFDKGSQSDIHSTDRTEESEFERKGNIGVKSAGQILQEHVDFWSMFEFYTFIFKDICKELLLTDDCLVD